MFFSISFFWSDFDLLVRICEDLYTSGIKGQELNCDSVGYLFLFPTFCLIIKYKLLYLPVIDSNATFHFVNSDNSYH